MTHVIPGRAFWSPSSTGARTDRARCRPTTARHSFAGNRLVPSLLALIVLAGGCASGPRSFRAPGPGIPSGTTIAFLQLRNLTENEEAGRLFTDKLLIELGRLRVFQIQDPGIVVGTLRQLRILTPDRMSADQMAALAATTGATYFLTGTVSLCEPGLDSPRQVPSAALSLWITDASSGSVIWAASLARTGDDSDTLFGLGRIRNLDQLAAGMAQDLVQEVLMLTEPGPPALVREETERTPR